ncbi:hypothetical protein [Frankia sp. R43]|uniref:hypothetical protein n=1 Tax=Frankia sp. R43 TaxID=269536 RepID=UPI0013796749|nr:hypothetical protein [Frankia sp. R43]
MGTSTDRAAGSGGVWTPLKHATTSYTRGLATGSPNTPAFARRVLARHVPVLGGQVLQPVPGLVALGSSGSARCWPASAARSSKAPSTR